MALSAIAACAPVPPVKKDIQQKPPEKASLPPREILAAGDTLKITIAGEPDLSRKYKISKSGTIVMPLVGVIDVAGKTPDDAAEVIRTAYQAGYIVSPDVYLELVQSPAIYVLGQIKSPGSYAWTPDLKAANAAGTAGCMSVNAGETYQIIRNGVLINATADTALEPGDVLRVSGGNHD